MLWNKEKQVHIVDELSTLQELCTKLKNYSFLALDTETNGVHRFRQVVGISFAISEDEGWYIPTQTWDVAQNMLLPFWTEEGNALIREILLQTRKYIGHNVQFDVGSIKNSFDINLLDSIVCDTMLLAHTARNEERPHGLKPLAALLLDENASASQDDVKANIKEKGGKTTQSQFDMYMCDYPILGKYAVYDVLYTFGIYNRLYPTLETQGLTSLWQEEVMPMLPVIYDLNNNGIKVDVPYFRKLKQELTDNILAIEDELYTLIRTRILPYEMERVKLDVKVTSRSTVGRKMLLQKKAKIDKATKELIVLENIDEYLYKFQCERKGVRRVFNPDSNDDKAHLIYDILGYECKEKTATGKRSVDADMLEELKASSEVSMLLNRATQKKLLSTYVEPLLEEQVDGIIYTNFKPTGTTSGRLSCGDPVNLQTIPRDDKRVKRGFIARPGRIFISADYSSLEPRTFAAISGERNLIKVYEQGLDLYSQAGIDIYGLKGVSASESDANYLKKVDPEMRQKMKVGVLARCYGASANRLAEAMKCTYEEATDFCDRYDAAYPTLSKWIASVKSNIKHYGYVKNLLGRKRRSNLVHTLYTKWGIENFGKRNIQGVFPRLSPYFPDYENGTELYYACKNNFDNAVNFSIQSVASSICNRALIDFHAKVKELKIDSKIVLTVHDSISVECAEAQKEEVAKILQHCMENNSVTKLISVPMVAEPVFCYSLEEDK